MDGAWLVNQDALLLYDHQERGEHCHSQEQRRMVWQGWLHEGRVQTERKGCERDYRCVDVQLPVRQRATTCYNILRVLSQYNTHCVCWLWGGRYDLHLARADKHTIVRLAGEVLDALNGSVILAIGFRELYSYPFSRRE